MSEAFQLITANRLRDGEVVYLGPGERWTERMADGLRLAGKAEADTALLLAQRFVAERQVVNPYLMDMTAPGKPRAMREVIRAAGPTVRTDLGKQSLEEKIGS
jgi:hypothetical protein